MELDILSKISKGLTQIMDANSIVSVLNKIFRDEFKINGFDILIYDEGTKTLRDFAKNWVIIDEVYDDTRKTLVYSALKQFKEYDFCINDKFLKSEDLPRLDKLDIGEKKSIMLPLVDPKSVYGLIELKFDTDISSILTNNLLTALSIAAYQISLKIQNVVLAEKMQSNIDFHEAMKNIAKIIETQYELNYIIPLIGEMIDKFISDHLIYIFLKNNGKFELVWPLACRDKKILDVVKTLDANSKYLLINNDRIGVFPLTSGNSLLGCIVAHSHVDKLTQKEIDYLVQLTKQSSITIHRANLYAEVLQHATLDALTGLNNRRQFEVRLRQEVATAKRQQKPLCAMMIDVDFFKSVNDTYGHQAGDEVLKNIANLIKNSLRESDIPSRYGGEEFSVLLPFTRIEEAYSVAQRLRLAVEQCEVDLTNVKDVNVDSIKVTISIGVYEFQQNDEPETLYGNADKALYSAKHHGRNKVVIYQE